MRWADGEHLARGAGAAAGVVARGSLEVVCGSMFSGKTEELLRRIKRALLARQRTQLFKPRVDNRYDAVKVVTHEGVNADALPVATAAELLTGVRPDVAVVGVDEVQFFDDGIVEVLDVLANRGKRVIVAGLDQDYRGRPFGPVPALMAIASSMSCVTRITLVPSLRVRLMTSFSSIKRVS